MKRKYELNLYAPFQYQDIQDHLEEMAERGWELEKASHRLFVYQAAEPGPVRYALAYRPEVGWMDQLPTATARTPGGSWWTPGPGIPRSRSTAAG